MFMKNHTHIATKSMHSTDTDSLKSHDSVIDAVKSTDTSSDKQQTDVAQWQVFAFVVVLIAVVCGLAFFISSLNHKSMDFESVYNRTLAGEVTPNNYLYNNFVFVRQSQGQLWITRAYRQGQEYELSFYYGPKELEFIPVQPNVYKTIIDTKKVYLVQDESLLQDELGPAKSAIASIELGKIVGDKYNILNKKIVTALSYPVYATTTNSDLRNDSLNSSNSSNSSIQSDFHSSNNSIDTAPAQLKVVYPVVTCEQATNASVVVLFALGNETVVKSLNSPHCILVQGANPNELIASATALTYAIMGIMR
jgi:hypothetical protein